MLKHDKIRQWIINSGHIRSIESIIVYITANTYTCNSKAMKTPKYLSPLASKNKSRWRKSKKKAIKKKNIKLKVNKDDFLISCGDCLSNKRSESRDRRKWLYLCRERGFYAGTEGHLWW